MKDDDRVNLSVRLPRFLRDWLAAEARENGSSINSELIRSVRERMARPAERGGDRETAA